MATSRPAQRPRWLSLDPRWVPRAPAYAPTCCCSTIPRSRERSSSLTSASSTPALDIKTGILVLEALAKVNRELATTTVVITHNVAIAEIADRVIHLSDGKIASVEVNPHKKSPAELAW